MHDADFLPRGTQAQVTAPVQPLGAVGETPSQPAGTLVKTPDQHQQFVTDGIQQMTKKNSRRADPYRLAVNPQATPEMISFCTFDVPSTTCSDLASR